LAEILDWAAPGSDDLHKWVRALESELEIPEGFLEGLINEADDWSFIIKLHALIEAAVTHLVVSEVDREPLNDLLADLRVPAKLALAKKLDLLEDDAVGYISTVAKIRNRFAHNVTAVGWRIEDYVNSLPTSERNQVWRWLAYFATDDTFELPDGKKGNTLQFAQQNPRLVTWWSAMNGFAVIYILRSTTANVRELREKVRKQNEFMAEKFGEWLEAARVIKKSSS
jgi:hypothetical protein